MRWIALAVLAALLAAGCGRLHFGDASGDARGRADAAGDAPTAAACTTDLDCHGCGSCDLAANVCRPFDFTTLRLGHRESIGVASDGSYWGWGLDEGFDLSIAGGPYDLPTALPALTGMVDVHLNDQYASAMAADGSLLDWGQGTATPTSVTAAAGWSDLRAGYGWSCAVKPDHTLWCWGSNYAGNLADGTTTNNGTPRAIPVLPPIASYDIDGWVGCAIDPSNQLWCWGDSSSGQTGQGTSGTGVMTTTPSKVGTTEWAQVAVATNEVCARKLDNSLWCWGYSYDNGATVLLTTPAQVGTRTDWIDVKARFTHNCALAADHSVWCFGDNSDGQIGQGDFALYTTPTQVALPAAASVLVLGGHTTCAIVGAAWWCWGRNDGSELGIGTTTNMPTPFQRCP